jgi:hypothetical protein
MRQLGKGGKSEASTNWGSKPLAPRYLKSAAAAIGEVNRAQERNPNQNQDGD